MRDRILGGLARLGVHLRGQFDRRELFTLRADRFNRRGRKPSLGERTIETRVEAGRHHDAEQRDRKQRRDARGSVVHAGGGARISRLNRTHHRRG